MLRKSLILTALAVLGLCVAPALAADRQVVHFTNGTTMTIENHEIEDGIVRVDLGGQSFMAFPVDRIEKIETAQGDVSVSATGSGTANRMLDLPRATPGVITGNVPSRYRRGSWKGLETAEEDSPIETDKRGIAVWRPYGKSAPENKRQFGVAGRRDMLNFVSGHASPTNKVGTARVGRKYVLPPKQPGVPKMTPIGLASRSGSSPKK